MTPQNIEIGPCRLSINGTDLGPTVGPVQVHVQTRWRDRRSERFGAAVVDRIALGTEVRVTVRLAEKTLANVQRALPTAAAGADSLSLGRAPGFKAGAVAGALRLHPEERADSGRDVLVHKAVAGEALEVEYAPGRRVFEVEFLALLDPTRGDGDQLAKLYQAD